MRLNVRYSEAVYYDDTIEFTHDEIIEMLDELKFPEEDRETLLSDPESLFLVVRESETFYDYLSANLTFTIRDSDDFQYDYFGLDDQGEE